MKLNMVWGGTFAEDLEKEENLADSIEVLLDMLTEFKDKDSFSGKDDVLSQKIFNQELSEWLETVSESVQLNTCKKQLFRIIEKLPDSQNSSKVCEIDFSHNTFHACKISEYYITKQEYLKESKTKSDFSNDFEDCFEHLYFHERVKSSINTLKSFKNVKAEIVTHLTALDSYNSKFIEHIKKGDNFGVIATKFQSSKKIVCSTESDRDDAKKRKFDFPVTDRVTKKINCELHTKLNYKNGTDNNRIHFHPGDSEVVKDKVLVAHIGRHI